MKHRQFMIWVAIGLLPSVAYAHSYRKIIAEDSTETGPSFCTFPDGTHPPRGEVHCYDPQQFLAAYGIDKLHQAGLTGKGQTIVLLDAFGSPTMQADLDTFSDTYGLPRKTIHFIYPNGLYVNPLTKADPKDASKLVADPDKLGWAGETTLDLEWAHAVAPDAELVNVITNVSETEGMAGLPELFRGIAMAAARYPHGIVSMSFGTGEPNFTGEEIDDELQGELHGILEGATRAGMTLLAATGDNGTASLNLDMSSMMDIRAAGYPATDPLVTAVGGTALEYGWKWTPQGTVADYMDCKSRQVQQKKVNPGVAPAACRSDFLASTAQAGSRTETVWNEAWALAAGGGGVSTIFDAPDYQAAMPAALRKQVSGRRAIPDVSMNAAVNGGVVTYQSYQVPGKDQDPQWTSVGGTSAATPEMAGLIALAGQRASDLLGQQVGIGALNPVLYGLAADDYLDITSQSFGPAQQVTVADNGLYFSELAMQVFGPMSETPNQVSGYDVAPGYDLATGLGSPIADRFVEGIARARAKVTPTLLP